MLTKFAVSGYRTFAEERVLDLTDVRSYRFNVSAVKGGVCRCGLLYGRNAVGKTSLATALAELSSMVAPPTPSQAASPETYLNADIEGPARFAYEFSIRGKRVSYQFEKTSATSLASESLEVDGALAFSFDHSNGRLTGGNPSIVGAGSLNWEFYKGAPSALSYACLNSGSVGGSVLLYDLYEFARNTVLLTDDRSPLTRVQAADKVARRAISAGKVEELEEFLHRFGIEETLRVEAGPSGVEALFLEHRRLIPFAECCSSGTLSLLRLFDLAVLGDRRPSLLVVDEFDARFHHDLAERVVTLFRDGGVAEQVMCTTHNTDLFSNKVLRPDCLFVLSESGLSSASSATKRELREGHNLEKLYKAGEFDV